MPHQCVRCSKIYPTGCKELLTGCSCGGKFFFFVKEDQLKKVEELMQSLSFEEKTQMENVVPADDAELDALEQDLNSIDTNVDVDIDNVN